MKMKLLACLAILLAIFSFWLIIMYVPGKTDSLKNYPKEERTYIKMALNSVYYKENFPSGVRIYRKSVNPNEDCGGKKGYSYEIWFRRYNFLEQKVGYAMGGSHCENGGYTQSGGIFLYPNQK
jgi:hypothetical protein